MKKLLLSMALVCFGVSAFAQQETAKAVNQYGQEVSSLPIETTVQDGILVFQNKNANYKMWFDVRLQADAAVFFDEPGYADAIGNGMSIRRARFAVKAQLDKNWYGEFDTDWTSGTPEIKDAIIAYTGLKNFEFKVGNFKENFSIQRNTTSRYLVFMERPMVTSLAPSRHLGLNVRYANKLIWASAGIFGPALKDSEAMGFMQDYNKDYGMDEGLSYTGKVVLRPINTPDASLHIGAAFSYRKPKTTEFKVKDFEELIEEDEAIVEAIEAGKFSELDVFGTAMDSRNSTDINRKKYVSSGDLIGVDYETAWTFELAGHYKGLRYEGAYIARTAHMKEAVNEVVYGDEGFKRFTGDGWYAQASYMLFGGSQAYDSNGAKYTRTTAGRNWGDLELAARYQVMDLNDAKFDANGDFLSGITGGKAEMFELGLNYYPIKNVKIVLNWAYINQDKYANGKGGDKGKFYVGYDKNGEPTKKSSAVVGKGGVDYQMLAMRFQVAF
ncbi:MAG: porin [Rikenellaceae bacterium]|nr:porin [Rikenellaceae bacterium]